MAKVRSHWHCQDCTGAGNIPADLRDNHCIRVLNLYAGIGGNRRDWTGVKVTAVENNPKIAAAYKRLYTGDTVIIGDAHQYLLKNYKEFDFIWASPPCPSHSIMNWWIQSQKKYPDMNLYSEVLFLKAFFKGVYVIENVIPYYSPLIAPDKKIGRHLFWSNLKISDFNPPKFTGVLEKKKGGGNDNLKIIEWLGIYLPERIYLTGKDHLQVYRNCVHPSIGKNIMNDYLVSRS